MFLYSKDLIKRTQSVQAPIAPLVDPLPTNLAKFKIATTHYETELQYFQYVKVFEYEMKSKSYIIIEKPK